MNTSEFGHHTMAKSIKVSVISEQEKVAKRLKIPKGEIEEQTKQ
jgi:hypothetical protein